MTATNTKNLNDINIGLPDQFSPREEMRSHRCRREKMSIYTYIHFCINSMYIHYVCVGTRFGNQAEKQGFVFSQ